MNDMLDYALAYLRTDFALLFLYGPRDGACTCTRLARCPTPGKHPRTPKGVHGATNDEAVVRTHLCGWRDDNVAVATGRASGVIVVDIDARHGGEESLAALCGGRDLGQPAISLTGGGGRHLFYRAPAHEMRNRAHIRPGIDIRADGGYAILPPSLHVSGTRYTWADGTQPGALRFAPMPDWLLQELSEPEVCCGPGYEPPEVDSFPAGCRNDKMFRLACFFRRHGLRQAPIERALLAVNNVLCVPPLPSSEVRTIAKNVMQYEPADE